MSVFRDYLFLSIAAHCLVCLQCSLFCELAQKSIFLVTVWFECIWVALFCFMELGMSCLCHASCIHLSDIRLVSFQSGCGSCVCGRCRPVMCDSALLEYVETIPRLVFLMTRSLPSFLIVAIPVDRSAICTSSQVLQAFSWICGLFRESCVSCLVLLDSH